METAAEYFDWIKKNKFLKTVASERDSFTLTDVAMRAGGADSAVYLKQPELQLRMRRGLTFLQKSNSKSVEIVRQGLPKFFDLEIKDQENKFLPHQYPITFHNLEKLNGENAQISHSKSIGKWIICSKNVAIACETLEEAESTYSTESRFTFPLYIARHWFNGCLPSATCVDELKELMNSVTFVGEVCDITENQHIVDNPGKQGLIFFAIVPKAPSGPKTSLCQLPDQAIPIFRKFNLKHVDLGQSEIINSPDDFPNLESFIARITVDASPDPYVCLSEGSVVYATDQAGKVLFLGKVKTTKYRILRRLRELLKNAASAKSRDSSDPARVRSKFMEDLKKWGFTDPKDVKVYMDLLEACQHVRVSQKWTLDRIGKWYINFLHEATNELKAGRVKMSAPVVDTMEPEGEGESPRKSTESKRKKGKRRGKGKPGHEVESSDNEDRAFSNLKGDVKIKANVRS